MWEQIPKIKINLFDLRNLIPTYSLFNTSSDLLKIFFLENLILLIISDPIKKVILSISNIFSIPKGLMFTDLKLNPDNKIAAKPPAATVVD